MLNSGCISALNETVTKRASLGSDQDSYERVFRYSERDRNRGRFIPALAFWKRGPKMDNIKLYEVNPKYINYLSAYAPHLFHNKTAGQANERKYIGVILTVNGMDYFAPLSSFKAKHARMAEAVDF